MWLRQIAEHIPLFGSIANAFAIVIGTLFGLTFRSNLPSSVTTAAFHSIGLVTLWLGVSMTGSTGNVLVLVFSVVAGTIAGEFLDLDGRLRRGAESLQKRIGASGNATEGFMTASLVFCMGSMAILGAIEEGVGDWPRLLLTKSLMDGIGSVAFAVSLGVGVGLSAISVFLYQGSITLAASALQPYMTQTMIDEISAVGGIMLIGIGLGILEIKRIKVMNMLPALLVAAIISAFI
ncbi:MAG: DUF554 domain-containing protein [Synergistota bacterium]|nr:DUF554 domain-containing protein [Synergistota bacterium]